MCLDAEGEGLAAPSERGDERRLQASCRLLGLVRAPASPRPAQVSRGASAPPAARTAERVRRAVEQERTTAARCGPRPAGSRRRSAGRPALAPLASIARSARAIRFSMLQSGVGHARGRGRSGSGLTSQRIEQARGQPGPGARRVCPTASKASCADSRAPNRQRAWPRASRPRPDAARRSPPRPRSGSACCPLAARPCSATQARRILVRDQGSGACSASSNCAALRRERCDEDGRERSEEAIMQRLQRGPERSAAEVDREQVQGESQQRQHGRAVGARFTVDEARVLTARGEAERSAEVLGRAAQHARHEGTALVPVRPVARARPREPARERAVTGVRGRGARRRARCVPPAVERTSAPGRSGSPRRPARRGTALGSTSPHQVGPSPASTSVGPAQAGSFALAGLEQDLGQVERFGTP